MRKALNENPTVQLAVLAVAGVALVIVMFMTVLKKDEAPADSPAAATTPSATTTPAASSGEPAPATTTPSSPAPSGAADGTAPPASSGEAIPADGLVPGKGLPSDVLVALAKDKAIALLVYEPHGPSDKSVKRYAKQLNGRDDVVAFTVKSKSIARYSRITEGVSVSQTPALVVVRPRKLTGDQLVATVSYGFRNAKSVTVALKDALYSGKTRSAAPEPG